MRTLEGLYALVFTRCEHYWLRRSERKITPQVNIKQGYAHPMLASFQPARRIRKK
jgi:hypothetical protein